MARVDEKIAETAFSQSSQIDFPSLVVLADKTAERCAGMVTKITRSGITSGVGMEYSIKRAGFMEVGSFRVRYTEGNASFAPVVAFEPGAYLTAQSTMFFIPIGPKETAALIPMRDFAKLLREGLQNA